MFIYVVIIYNYNLHFSKDQSNFDAKSVLNVAEPKGPKKICAVKYEI